MQPDASRRATLAGIVSAANAGQLEAARAACAAELAKTPADPVLQALAAMIALRSDRPADAVAHAENALATRPDHVATLMILGGARRALGAFEAAADAFARAATLQPDRPAPAFALCATRLAAGDPAAASLLDPLLARFPHAAAGWEDIGQVLLDAGQRVAAAVCLSRALAVAPGLPLAMRLGLLLRDLGRTREAAQAFETAVACDPAAVRAWFLLGLSRQDAGDGPGAAAAYRAALDRDPSLAEAAVNLGVVLQESGDLDGARAEYAHALRLRADTFGRIAQAITTAPRGELWLDLAAFRRSLGG